MVRFLCALVLLFALVFSVEARPTETRLPEEQWDHNTRLWLARAFVSEAGWKSERDHIAIAYVIERRWRNINLRFPRMRFVDVVRNYCAGLGFQFNKHGSIQRQRWIRGLAYDGIQPEAWPVQASWKQHRPLWADALQRAESWHSGRLKDPCNGRAWHWGGAMDLERAIRLKLKKIDCGETRNTFFEIGDNNE